HRESSLAQSFAILLIEPDRVLGRGGGGEAGTPALAAIAEQGELADHEDLAAHLLHREVHPAPLVGKGAEMDGLFRQVADVLRPVALAHAEQHEPTAADPADR